MIFGFNKISNGEFLKSINDNLDDDYVMFNQPNSIYTFNLDKPVRICIIESEFDTSNIDSFTVKN